MICACIGVPAVKDNYLAGETEVRSTLLKMEIIRHITKLYSEGFDTFMCGCYPGVPLWTGESIISLRRDFPGFEKMKLFCCMPYDGFIGDLPPTFENRVFVSSLIGTMRNAPRIGPNGVPEPPMMQGIIASIETVEPKTADGSMKR